MICPQGEDGQNFARRFVETVSQARNSDKNDQQLIRVIEPDIKVIWYYSELQVQAGNIPVIPAYCHNPFAIPLAGYPPDHFHPPSL